MQIVLNNEGSILQRFFIKKKIQDSGVKDVVLSPNGHVEPH